jgi:protein KRI1
VLTLGQVGDLPTRFKYTQVPKGDLGLSVEDILRLTDRELNSYVSVKKLAPYRMDQSEALKKSKRKKLKELKLALLKRKWGESLPTGKVTGEVDLERYSKKRKADEGVDGAPAGKKPKKRMGKKERQRLAKGGEADAAAVQAVEADGA